jgi:hypothetical protein
MSKDEKGLAVFKGSKMSLVSKHYSCSFCGLYYQKSWKQNNGINGSWVWEGRWIFLEMSS